MLVSFFLPSHLPSTWRHFIDSLSKKSDDTDCPHPLTEGSPGELFQLGIFWDNPFHFGFWFQTSKQNDVSQRKPWLLKISVDYKNNKKPVFSEISLIHLSFKKMLQLNSYMMLGGFVIQCRVWLVQSGSFPFNFWAYKVPKKNLEKFSLPMILECNIFSPFLPNFPLSSSPKEIHMSRAWTVVIKPSTMPKFSWTTWLHFDGMTP